MADTSYAQGSLRYFFFHGNHGDVPIPDQMIVEANIVVLNGQGQIVSGDNFENGPSHYQFTNGAHTETDGQAGSSLPAKPLVERLLKNVSVPTLVLAEVPKDQMGNDFGIPDPFPFIAVLVLGRSDLRPCTAADREYLTIMMRGFIPRLIKSMSPISSHYLPGDARNLCVAVADRMELLEADHDFEAFITTYRRRYVQKPLSDRIVLEQCLLHGLKMPFELGSSIQTSLIRY